MTPSDETLMAYVDGELDTTARSEFEAALARDPALAQRVEAARRLRTTLSRAFDPVLAEPVPERLVAAAHGRPAPANVQPLPAPRAARPIFPAARAAGWSWPQWGALAASLVLGLLLGPRLLSRPGTITTQDGRLVAAGSLAAALDTQLASTQTGSEPAHIGVSFRSGSGEYCRTFDLRGGEALAGLACRRGGRWQVDAVMTAGGERSGDYTSASGLPPALAALVGERIAGDALDANEEDRKSVV